MGWRTQAGTRRRPAAPARPDPARDRFVDLIRVVSMLAVVVLHWVSVMPDLRNGKVVDRNVVEVVPGLWPLTWTGDVMALFFFAGGYANWVSLTGSLRRGESSAAYLERRFRRLLQPTLTFLGLWLGSDLLLRAAGHGDLSPLRHVTTGNTIPFGPLWFIAVYLVVVALSPWTIAAHRRWGLAVPVAMAIAVAVADAVAFARDSGAPLVVNLLLVWLVPHQLGYFYADGRLRLSTLGSAALAASGLTALVLLTSLPAYPRSLISPRWTVLTMDAPMLSLVAEGLWLIGLALLLRRPAERILANPARWRWVSRANEVTMPVYLWHMTAYLVAAAVLARAGAGFVYATAASAAWWWGRPVIVLLSAGVLAGILALLRAAAGVRRPSRPVPP
jgi:Acyltransferase family